MTKLSDQRTPFFMVEDAIFEFGLTPYEGWVYMAILKHADRQTGVAFPGIARLVDLCKMSRRQVIRAIQALEEKGILTVQRDTLPQKGEDRNRKINPNHYIVKSLSNQTGIVPVRHYNSATQALPIVPTRHPNKSNIEPESKNKKDAPNGAIPPTPFGFKANKAEASYWNEHSGILNHLRAVSGVDVLLVEVPQSRSELLKVIEAHKDLCRAGLGTVLALQGYLKWLKDEKYPHAKTLYLSQITGQISAYQSRGSSSNGTTAAPASNVIPAAPERTADELAALDKAIEEIRPVWETQS